MHLIVSLAGAGHHPAAWRPSPLPTGPSAAPLQQMARTAERGRLDAVLLGIPSPGTAAGNELSTMPLDPLPLLGSLIAVTERIGLAAAWAVDYAEPFHVARVFATLDYLSYGRSAWIADLFQTERLRPRIGKPPETADLNAYLGRAAEFVEVVRKLWDSWEDQAFALDKASGMFVDPGHVHPIEHAGRNFTVRGPLNVPRPPQGNPPLILHDPPGYTSRQFAAATADVILTAPDTLAQACARYRELRSLAAAAGRDPEGLRIVVNLSIVLAPSDAAARDRAATLDAMKPPGPGLRFVGTPAGLVDFLATWHHERGGDGFNLLPAVLPDDLDQLVNVAIPLARRGGLYRADYTGATLRDHLGLSRPASRYEASR